ncbi:hypothetical protein [Methylobacterium sp. B1]|uniref:hypothetical protein n=1 Tax=Methylobacterium sp. B1 TaxID=91459 RepID=UPI0003471866|nr:hypothetical protein [Methylobacterium sp. B1]
MRTFSVLAVATIASVTAPAAALASPKAEKVYAANGRRVAVIKRTAFGAKVYGESGRRIATVRSR